MAQILRRHSVFFWLHLYRRIGVGLSPEHGGKTDANTVGLVRQIVELAISKHGDKTRKDDLAPVSKVHFKDILGGHCQRLWQRWLGPVDALGKFRRLAATRQWVITQFEIRDFIDAYLVEGYAYEYWRVTALMRAVGKGSGFAENADDWPDTRESLSLSRLIISYDQRIATRRPFSTALLGSWFHSSFEPRNRDEKMLVPFITSRSVVYVMSLQPLTMSRSPPIFWSCPSTLGRSVTLICSLNMLLRRRPASLSTVTSCVSGH